MASKHKELKALITLSGKLDPSLQKALLEAAGKTRNLQVGLAGLAVGKAKSGLTTLAKNAIQSGGAVGKVARGISDAKTSLVEFTQKNTVAKAAMTSLGKVSHSTMGILKSGAKAAALGFAGLAAAGVMALGMVAKEGLKTASDLSEVQNVVDVTFGEENAKKINGWSQSVLKSHGLSELSAKKYSSTLGAMMKSSNLSGESVLTMSQNLTQLAGDMASFYNLDSETAFEKLRSGISGETEPLKQLGINMSVANLEAFALSQGIKKSYNEMSQAEQMTLRYNYIMKATSDAQGDFARTSGSLANQQKLLKENLSQLAGKVMTAAVPAITQVVSGLNNLMGSMDTTLLSGFITDIIKLGTQLSPIATRLLPLIGDTLKTVMPVLIEIISLVLPPVVDFLEIVIKAMNTALSKGAEVIGKIIDYFKGAKGTNGTSSDAPTFPKYASGGFANRPSIFGEAGLEAAIPIKRGNKRSISLLERTANMLGVRMFGGNTVLHYAPVISGANREEIEPVLYRHSQEIEAMLNARSNMERRLSFGV